MCDPDVSVIIVAKNEEKTIESCLKSVFNQSHEPFEVILVDGRSTDSTVEKAKNFPVKIIIETGKGSPSNARNLGAQNASGEILLILDADAELDYDCIKNALKYFRNPQVLTVFPFLEIRVHTFLEKIQQQWFYGTRSRFRTATGTGSAIVFIRRDVFLSVKYDPEIGFGDDSDFRRRLAKIHPENKEITRPKDVKVFIDLPHSFFELYSQNLWYGRTSYKYYARYHSYDAFIRLGSILLPFFTLLSGLVTILFPSIFYIYILLFGLLLLRNILACYRARSKHFFEFILFDFARSVFYVLGIIQGIFITKTGR
ncbi:MAG: glycosyltransferase family 2 protein [Candidatus Jordarchaeaceae archaeon]